MAAQRLAPGWSEDRSLGLMAWRSFLAGLAVASALDAVVVHLAWGSIGRSALLSLVLLTSLLCLRHRWRARASQRGASIRQDDAGTWWITPAAAPPQPVQVRLVLDWGRWVLLRWSLAPNSTEASGSPGGSVHGRSRTGWLPLSASFARSEWPRLRRQLLAPMRPHPLDATPLAGDVGS